MHQLPSIREASATGRMTSRDLEPNLEYRLVLTIRNGNRTNSIQVMVIEPI